jgi:hypothetical protein
MAGKRTHEISRLEAFSDAVFAFALTLLVVSLEAPKSYAELMHMLKGFLPFAGCFALLIYIWYEHSVFFSRYDLQGRAVTVLNAALLFVVLFYVYPLKYLFTLTFASVIPDLRTEGAPATGEQIAHLFLVYGVGFIAVFGALALLYQLAWRRRHELGLTPLEARDARAEMGTHLTSVAVGVVSMLWAAIAPSTLTPFAGFVYFLMGPAHWAYGELNGRRRQAFIRAAERAARA